MIPLTIRQLVYLIVAIIFAAFLLVTMTHSIIGIASANVELSRVIIPALGSLTGGIIGGIVAIIIAAYNASRSSRNDQCKQLRTSLTMLKLIREELQDNITVLESTIPYQIECHRILKTQLSDDTWKSAMTKLLISDDLLVRLNVCYRKISLFKNLEPHDVNDDFIRNTKEQCTITLESIRTEINQLGSELK
jgi:gas vesicle protein